jgi:nicotinate-nucleotide pyrophosphorylase (carboxylating)
VRKNYRFGFDSGVLIKEDHIAAGGGVHQALEEARKISPHTLRIQIECETLAQMEEAIALGAGAILLDNMGLDEMRQARTLADGGVTLETVSAPPLISSPAPNL